jgi:hypothetical protein
MTRPVERKVFKAPPPAYDVNSLYYIQDGRDWIYEPTELYTKAQVILPGHLNAWREELRIGSRITARLGSIEDGIQEVEMQIISCPKSDRLGDVMVSVKGRDGQFTPCRHDGTLDDSGITDQKE